MSKRYQQKYSSQPMQISSRGQPSVQPWRYLAAMLAGRYFALGLAIADGFISYGGLRDWQVETGPALAIASLIALVQGAVGVALTSGQPIGEKFQQRFFGDRGPLGTFKRVMGCVVVIFITSIYLVDIITNFVEIHGLSFQFTVGGCVRALALLTVAAFFTIGDEVLHCFADDMATGLASNNSRYMADTYSQKLNESYQQSYMKTAYPRSRDIGVDHGEHWNPSEDN